VEEPFATARGSVGPQGEIDLHARMLGRRDPATGLDLHLQAQILDPRRNARAS